MSKILFILLAISITPLYGQSRGPAVEDFVGVETEYNQKTPAGTEVLFNFGNHIKVSNSIQQSQSQVASPLVGGLVVVSFILLPAFMWFGLTRTVGQVQEEPEFMVHNYASTKVEDNVVPLPVKEKSVEEVKKAS